jgi:hypothetical protein
LSESQDSLACFLPGGCSRCPLLGHEVCAAESGPLALGNRFWCQLKGSRVWSWVTGTSEYMSWVTCVYLQCQPQA